MMSRSVFFIVVLLTASSPGDEAVSFNRDIRPILANHCFACHGPDAKHREADLRLDQREHAVQSGAIVPASPEQSEVIRRVLSTDADQRMPPEKTKKLLSPREIDLLKRWISQGAVYEGHWAFLPVVDARPPAVAADSWVKNGIDQFILAELAKHKLAPSPEAERATLIRRLSLDLLGVLPAPEEVREFISDNRPDAYERLVDRLLASPHYGERWGRHWLDQARYADSNGYTIDSERAMWPYRDWVIKALIDDLPFDQFTIEQLAGDLLPQPTRLQRIATGFHRNTMINEEGGTDAEQFRNDIVFDRVATTGSVWLGLTLGCAQCHSHKFDPTSHREYYEFFAFFNSGSDVNNRGETLEVFPGEVLGSRAPETVDNHAAEVARKNLEQLKQQAAARQAAWEQQVAEGIAEPKWVAMEIDRFDAQNNRSLKKLDDGSILAARDGAAKDVYECLVSAKLYRLAAIRLVVLPHESLAGSGAGTAGNGNFVLSEFEVDVDGKPAALKHALADHQKPGYLVTAAIDGQKSSGWALQMDRGGQGEHEAWFYFADPLPMTTGKITVKLRFDVNDHYQIGRFNLYATNVAPANHPDRPLWNQVEAAAKTPVEQRDQRASELLGRTFMELDAELAAAIREAAPSKQNAANGAVLMVMRELEKPRTTYLLSRGDFLNPDKQLGPLMPSTPAWLPASGRNQESEISEQGAGVSSQESENSKQRANRLDLARWLVRKDNPLTPRVTVNRVWMRYFGVGLVETENDFGLQGTPPSHPELLDFLASEFVQQGWSLKQLHRLIVTSASYRQSSRHRPELAEIDPENRMLARQNRLRLDAETVRDAALSASGLLDRTLGGPTTHPPQPEGVYAFTQNKKAWKTSQGGERHRRAIYTTFIRSAPYPLFTTFDAPGFATACTRRPRSNTPLQALTVANDEVFLEFASALAERIVQETAALNEDSDSLRLAHAFAHCYARQPSAREMTVLLDYVQQQRREVDSETLVWSAVARVLLNTDEFIVRE